jgi:hypothetical protein
MEEAAEFCCDSVNFEVGAYGFTLSLGKGLPPVEGSTTPGMKLMARAHLSPQHAKELAKGLFVYVKQTRRPVRRDRTAERHVSEHGIAGGVVRGCRTRIRT